MRLPTDYTLILKKGKKNAIPSKTLTEMMGYKNERALQTDISRSRAAGQLIISATTGGYYLPANREEIEEFLRSVESRARNTFLAVKSARKALQEIEGQQNLFDDEGAIE